MVRFLNPLTPNDHYSGRTAPLTSKRFILYIYSTNIGTEYFKHCIYSPCFSLQNAICFIILTYLVPVLFTFIYRCAKIKKNNSGAKRLSIIKVNRSYKSGHAIAQGVSRWPVTKEAWFRSRVIPCGICGGQSGTGTFFSSSTSLIPCWYDTINNPCSSSCACCCYFKKKRTKVGNLPNRSALWEIGELCIENNFHLVFTCFKR